MGMKHTAQQPAYLSLADVAQRLGVTQRSATRYHQTAQRNRRRGTARAADMPAPDKVFGRSPAWKPATLEAWIPRRGQR